MFEIENAIPFFKGHVTMKQKLEQYFKQVMNEEVIEYDAMFRTKEENRFQAVPIILNYFLSNILKFRSKFCKVIIPCIERDETDYYAFVKDFKMKKTFLIVYAYKIDQNVKLIYPKDDPNIQGVARLLLDSKKAHNHSTSETLEIPYIGQTAGYLAINKSNRIAHFFHFAQIMKIQAMEWLKLKLLKKNQERKKAWEEDR